MHRTFNHDIFARLLVIMKNVISFLKEYRGPTFRPPCDVIGDVIIIKNTFYGIIWDDLFICDVKLKLCLIFQNFQNGRHFELAKIAISIFIFWAFDRCSSSNIDGDISISKFDLWPGDVIDDVVSAWNITCTTRHPNNVPAKYCLCGTSPSGLNRPDKHRDKDTHKQTHRAKTLSLR